MVTKSNAWNGVALLDSQWTYCHFPFVSLPCRSNFPKKQTCILPFNAAKGGLKMERLTHHARIRCQQRGVNEARLLTFLKYADIDRPAGRGCRSLRLSRAVSLGAKNSEQLLGLELILSPEGKIITAKHQRRRRPSWRFPSGRARFRRIRA